MIRVNHARYTFWGRKLIRSTALFVALTCSASVVLADIKITTKSSASGQSLTSTTYIKGARQRTEGMGYTNISQCDLKRTIQINDKTKTYFISPADPQTSSGSATPGSQGSPSRRAGVITFTVTNTDTGERREILGLTARHIKSKTVIEASEGACNSMNMEMEADGWYADLVAGQSCPTDASPASMFPPDQSGCVDEIRYKTVGTAKLGYPIMVTTTIRFNPGAGGGAANIPASSTTQEVVDVSNVKLDASLFEIPAGYREVKSVQELGSPF